MDPTCNVDALTALVYGNMRLAQTGVDLLVQAGYITKN